MTSYANKDAKAGSTETLGGSEVHSFIFTFIYSFTQPTGSWDLGSEVGTIK